MQEKPDMRKRKIVADQHGFLNGPLSCSVTSLKRLLDSVTVLVLVVVTLTLIYRPAAMFHRPKKIHLNEENVEDFVLTSDFEDDGFFFAPVHEKEKYLSYEPPVGSWSKQLQAFENAVIISKLLNRTLLARALASEPEIKRLQRVVRKNLQPDSKVYDLLDKKFTVSISSAVDFSHLSKLIRVRDVIGSNQQFLSDYKNMSWYDVCHKDSEGFWVDFIPASNNQEAWKVLEAQHFVPLTIAVSGTEPACGHEPEIQTDPYKPKPFIRGIISELGKIEADMVYFRGGSVATSEIRFLSKKRTTQAQKWALDYIRFTPYLQQKTQKIIAQMVNPYNAVLFSKEEEELNLTNTINFRLKQMEKMRFRDVTNVLYIITRVYNSTVFEPFKKQGYEIKLSDRLIPSGISSFVQYDVEELFMLIICKYARLYVGSNDPYLIQRGRIHEANRRDGIFIDHVTVKWAAHTVNGMYRFSLPNNTSAHSLKAHRVNYITCTICKFMQNTEKHALCLPLMSECAKLRLN